MTRLVSPGIERLRPYVAGKPLEELERELGIREAVKLASNENPLGASPKALAAAQAVLGNTHRYPDASAFELRRALAQKLAVGIDEIVLGNGSNELLDILVRTFVTSEQHVVFAAPSFVVYEMASMAANAEYTAVPLVDYRHPLEQMLAAVTDATQLIFIANPNNPTGTFVTRAELEWFLPRIPKHVVVALDEAYFEYADSSEYPDGLTLRGLHERLIVLRTFSKAYGLAGMRLGYLVAPEELTGYVNRVRAPFNASSIAQAAALAALTDTEHLARVTTLNAVERSRLSDALKPLARCVVPSQANFIYAEFDKPAAELYDSLLRRGVIVRPVPPMKHGLRISVGLPAENDRLIQTLKEVLGASD